MPFGLATMQARPLIDRWAVALRHHPRSLLNENLVPDRLYGGSRNLRSSLHFFRGSVQLLGQFVR